MYLDIRKLNLKKNLLIINQNGKNRKYHLDKIISNDDYSLFHCEYYRFIYLEQINDSAFKSLFNTILFDRYLCKNELFPYHVEFDKNSRIIEMCITVLYKNGQIDNILNHDETVDFFDSILIMNKLAI